MIKFTVQIMTCAFMAAAVFCSGCGYKMTMVSRVDPSVLISKADPVYVAPLDRPTIYARQALVELNNELCRGGFNIVQDHKKAKWTLVYDLKTATVESGFSSQTFGNAFWLGGSLYSLGETQISKTYADTAQIFLGVFPKPKDTNDKPLIMWEATADTSEKIFRIYQPVVFNALLNQFGKNFNGYTRLSKGYLSDAKEMGTCRR